LAESPLLLSPFHFSQWFPFFRRPTAGSSLQPAHSAHYSLLIRVLSFKMFAYTFSEMLEISLAILMTFLMGSALLEGIGRSANYKID